MAGLTIPPRIAPDRPETWALVGAACGLLAAVPVGPSSMRALLLFAFVALGPGGVAVAPWAHQLPPTALRALVPVVGFAVVLLAVTGALLLGFWSPRTVLLALAIVTMGAATTLLRRTPAPVSAR